MPKTKAVSPARSQGGITTPKRRSTRGSRSLCSPALSTASGRLTSLIDQFKDKNMESFALSPLNGRSVLNDNTEIEEPRRKSWWKKLGENSQDVMEVLEENKLTENNPIEELIDIEVLSQEKKNYTLDLPESSDNETINSIVLPQRRLFTQKENQPQKKYGHLIDNRESLAILHKTNTNIDKTVNVGTRELFQNAKRSKPIFPAALLNISPNKTAADKTRENVQADPKAQVRNIFGNRPANKRKNMFADFIVSESEDEIPDIQPKVFGFQKKMEQQRVSSISRGREGSPGSSITADIEMDFRMMLPSSTMVENQLEDMVASTPVKRARLSKLTEAKESEAGTLQTTTSDRTKQSNKSASSKNKSKANDSQENENQSEEEKVIGNESEKEENEINDSEQEGETKEIQEVIDVSQEVANESQEVENKSEEEKEDGNESENEEDEVNESEQEGEANESKEVVDVSQEVENQSEEEKEEGNESELEEDEVNESEQEGEANESQEVADVCQEVAYVSQEVADVSQEVADVSQEVANESQEVENETEEEQDEGNLSQEVETEVNVSQEVANESEGVDNDEDEIKKDEDQANEDQKVEAEVNDCQEVANESQGVENDENKIEEDEDSSHESREVEAEVNESHEIDEEANESQEIEKESNESQEIDDDALKSHIVEHDEAADQDSDEEMEEDEEEAANESEVHEASANESQEVENDKEESHVESEAEVSDSAEVENDQQRDYSDEADKAIATDTEISDQDNTQTDESEHHEHESHEERQIEEQNEIEASEEIDESPNVTHDTTGRHRKKDLNKSPEVILHNKTNQIESFYAKGRNTSARKTKSLIKNLNIKPSLAPPRDSTGFSDGTKNSSAEGSGWDSHRITRKTLRQTFGKDFTPRKSLRAMVMEKSAKRRTEHMEMHSETVKLPLANSTEMPEDSSLHVEDVESDHELSRRARQTTLEQYLQKIKEQNIDKKLKMEAAVRNSLKAPVTDSLSLFKLPSKPAPRQPKPTQNKRKKQLKSISPFGELPSEVIEDMKYKPPKRFQPTNASWITKRLYKFLETKLEPTHDYKARVRAEKLVETIYLFAKDLRRHDVAPAAAVDQLKHEFARLNIVRTHFDFYDFFHEFLPREVRIKVIPDIVNKIALPRHGVFSDILRGNTVHG